MGDDSDNPYSPPLTICPAKTFSQQTSVARGILCAVPAATVGFAIPYLISTPTFVTRWLQDDPPAFRLDDLFSQAVRLASAAFFCALVFGLAAVVNYTPPKRLGLVRAIMFVGFAALFGVLGTTVLTVMFDLGPQTYTSDPWAGLRFAMTTSVPLCFAIGLTVWRVRH